MHLEGAHYNYCALFIYRGAHYNYCALFMVDPRGALQSPQTAVCSCYQAKTIHPPKADLPSTDPALAAPAHTHLLNTLPHCSSGLSLLVATRG